MRLEAPGAPHLTYCTSIHPGETWPEVRRNLERHIPAVKASVSPDRPFGIGLRLSSQAALALAKPAALDEFHAFLQQQQLYVFTINGFPYGEFGQGRIKERVYLPDWRDDARLAYTDRLGHILAALLPPDLEGSISTAPGAFRAHLNSHSDPERMAELMLRHAATLSRLRQCTGKMISLALEPEPACCLETAADAVEFFQHGLFGKRAQERFGQLTGLAPGDCEAALRCHLGVCLDTCHAAIEFETADETVAAYRAAGIQIAKVQVSAGLCVPADSWNSATREALMRFDDGIYLHQVVAQDASGLRRYVDLPEAFADSLEPPGIAVEWRVHCHVPIFLERLGSFASTQAYLHDLFALYRRTPFTTQFEVETYTWHVLPKEYRGEDVTQSVSRELQWAQRQLVSGS